MEAERIDRKKYPSPGECIYCGVSAKNAALFNEHIIPFSLGGNVEILNASCAECARVTTSIEDQVGQKILFDFRVHAKIQTRRKKQRPTALPISVTIGDGLRQNLILPVQDHPFFTPYPVWGPPGLLDGRLPEAEFLQPKVHLFWWVPPNIREILSLSDSEIARIAVPQKSINLNKFARAIAKMAYCQAVVYYGLHNWRRLVLPDLILGRYPFVPYFVGAALSDPPPRLPIDVQHLISLEPEAVGDLKLLVASIRLFANSGTDLHGPPIYRVVVGAPNVS